MGDNNKPSNDPIQSVLEEAKKILKDKRNKNALAASTIAFYLSKDNKERNAIVAGVLAYAFLSEEEN